MLVFVIYQVAAEPHAQGDASTGENSSIVEPRAKVAAGANANAGLLLETGYYTYGIHRANLDGSNVETLITLLRPVALALDVGRGKMYWTEKFGRDAGKIRRANLDGSNVEDLITTGIRPSDIALDVR